MILELLTAIEWQGDEYHHICPSCRMSQQHGHEKGCKLAEAKAAAAQHDLCHNGHGKVDAQAFAAGCEGEQRRLYGCAPHADRIAAALGIAFRDGLVDGSHHKMWAIDQMVRALCGGPVVRSLPNGFVSYGESEEYRAWVRAAQAGEEGPATYQWDEGIAP